MVAGDIIAAVMTEKKHTNNNNNNNKKHADKNQNKTAAKLHAHAPMTLVILTAEDVVMAGSSQTRNRE